jgi:hypothetical protein
MEKILFAVSMLAVMTGMNPAVAGEEKMQMDSHHHHAMQATDTRTSLGLSPQMKQHQLANMREHVAAIKSIVGLMAESRFEEAAGIAHAKLGLTPEMQQMCGMFGNDAFKALGLAFHKSGDDLGDALQTGDVNASLRALNKTMEYCVTCHATFRQ